MSERLVIAAVLYPLCQTVLFGTGVVAASVLAPTLPEVGVSLARACLASLVLAAPLAWAMAPILASPREQAKMDRD